MSTDITRYQPTASLPDMVRYAEHLAEANLLPRQYQQRPANVLYAMEYGRTLGITPLAAITGIHVIEGKPSASAALISGLVRQAGHKLRVRGNDQEAWAQIIRADDPTYEGYQVTWTLERARQAGLAGKDVWKKYPAAMLKARAITEVARDACEEVLFGLHYTPEELGANVSEDGLPVDAPVQQLRRVEPGEADPWATPARDFLAEAETALDAATVRRIWQEAKQAGMPAPTLNAIVEVGRLKAAAETEGGPGEQQAAADVVDGEVVEDEHAAAVAELRAFAAEHRITDIDADAYTALGAPLDDVSPEAIRALLAQLRGSAAA